MKKLLLFLPLFALLSCGVKDDLTKSDCEACEGLIGKRWYVNIDRTPDGQCFGFEDFRLNDNGTVDIWRIATDENGLIFTKQVNGVCNYSLDNCTISLSKLSDEYLKSFDEFTNCPYDIHVLFSYIGELKEDPNYSFTVLTNQCDSFQTGLFTFTSFEP
jgi:hypothetical protein